MPRSAGLILFTAVPRSQLAEDLGGHLGTVRGRNLARGQRAERRGSPATLEQRPLAEHRAGSDLATDVPSTSTESTPSSSTYISLPLVALVDERRSGLDGLDARFRHRRA